MFRVAEGGVKARTLKASVGCKAEDNGLFHERFIYMRIQDPFHSTSKDTFCGEGDSCLILLYKCPDSFWLVVGNPFLQYNPCICRVISGFCCITPGERIGTWGTTGCLLGLK